PRRRRARAGGDLPRGPTALTPGLHLDVRRARRHRKPGHPRAGGARRPHGADPHARTARRAGRAARARRRLERVPRDPRAFRLDREGDLDMNEIKEKLLVRGSAAKVFRALTEQAGYNGWWSKDCQIGSHPGDESSLRFDKEGTIVSMRFRVDDIV